MHKIKGTDKTVASLIENNIREIKNAKFFICLDSDIKNNIKNSDSFLQFIEDCINIFDINNENLDEEDNEHNIEFLRNKLEYINPYINIDRIPDALEEAIETIKEFICESFTDRADEHFYALKIDLIEELSFSYAMISEVILNHIKDKTDLIIQRADKLACKSKKNKTN